MPPRADARALAQAKKRARIQNAMGVARVGSTTLARIIGLVRQTPELMEDVSSRKDVDKAMLAVLDEVSITLDVPLIGGGARAWQIASLPKLLHFLCERSKPYRELLQATYAKHASTPLEPWHLIIAEDELTPGALLHLDNKRKTLAHYCSIAEFGFRARKHTAAWLPLAFMRSSEIKKVLGGTSGLERALFRHLLLGENSPRIKGAVLPIGENGSPVYVFLDIGRTVTDELGEKNLWSTRGATASLPCFSCKNVTGLGDKDLAPFSASGYLVDISCPFVEQFDPLSADELFEKCDILSELSRTLNQGEMRDAQKRLGMTFSPHGVLWDSELREHMNPFKVNLVDGAHSLLCNGMAQKELTAVFRCLHHIGVGFQEVRGVMSADWRTCRALGGPYCRSSLQGIFNEAREGYFKSHKEFPGGASEMLIALPAVRFWIEIAPGLAGRVPLLLRSLASLCKVLTLYQRAKQGINVSDEFRAALREHGVNKHNAYRGMDGIFAPKDHYAKHIPAQIARDKELMDTLVAERYHQLPKLGMDSIDNTKTFEATVLGRAVMLHLNLVQSNDHAFTTKLLGYSRNVADIIEEEDASASSRLSFEGLIIGKDDVIRVDGAMVLVDTCLRVNGSFYVIASRLLPVRNVTPSAVLHRKGECEIFELSRIELVALWSLEGEDVLVLV